MPKLLVTVEEAFVARGRGVLVEPRFTLASPIGPKLRVLVKLPDGREVETAAEIETSHMRGPNGTFAMVRLTEMGVGDVPRGAEIWTT